MDEIIENKRKYRKTKTGWIPIEWEVKRIINIVTSIKSGVSVNSENREKQNSESGILKTSSVSNGMFIPSQNKAIVLEGELERAKLNPQKNSLLISRMNTPDLVGACAYINETREDLFIPDRLWLTQLDFKMIDARWLNYLLNSNHYRFIIKNLATGTSNSMKNISKESFQSIQIPFPHSQNKKK